MINDLQSIWQLAAMQLLKDCGMVCQNEIIAQIRNKEDLMQMATWVVSELLNSGSHSLTAALYRLDIPEKKIRLRTQTLTANERVTTVAIAAAERCIQKVEMRRLYSDMDRND